MSNPSAEKWQFVVSFASRDAAERKADPRFIQQTMETVAVRLAQAGVNNTEILNDRMIAINISPSPDCKSIDDRLERTRWQLYLQDLPVYCGTYIVGGEIKPPIHPDTPKRKVLLEKLLKLPLADRQAIIDDLPW